MSGVPGTKKPSQFIRACAYAEVKKGIHGMPRERFVQSWHSHVQKLAGEHYDLAKAAYEKLQARIADADMKGSNWLAKGNEYAEKGNSVKAEQCYDKGQYWLDRSNKLRGDA